MLGVVWGTASVVCLLGWGRGFIKGMEREARVAGDGYIALWPKRALSDISGHRGARQLKFQLKDVDVIRDHCPSVRYVNPVDDFWTLFKHGNTLKGGNIYGVGVDAPSIYNLNLKEGRFLHPADLDARRRVVVLGADIRDALFPGGAETVGRKIKLRGISFEVIGVLKRKGQQLVDMGGADDEKAYIPITSFMQYLSGSRFVTAIDVQPKDTHHSEDCRKEIIGALAQELGFSPDDREAIEVFDLAAMIRILDTMTLIIAVFITFVGIITLFVGGVGVMNIMLISITERTREIGLRKALGARRRHILLQFFAEALTITVLSGVIGMLAGCGISFIIAAVPKPSMLPAPELSLFTLTASFFVMVCIGFFAGTLPALRAARMDPVRALRYE
jgi:ABC-type antimicrobial peptide transport system permease subunit